MVHMYKENLTYQFTIRGTLIKMQYLLILIHDEKYMCWTKNKEDSDVMTDIFLTHLDFVRLLNMFHLVLIFDYTDKTNRYMLPQLGIVGNT